MLNCVNAWIPTLDGPRKVKMKKVGDVYKPIETSMYNANLFFEKFGPGVEYLVARSNFDNFLFVPGSDEGFFCPPENQFNGWPS